MPGTFVFRPIEATLDSEATPGPYRRSLDPLCKVQIGHQNLCTHPSKCFGTHPEWDEALIAQEGEENTCRVSLEDNNKGNPNRGIGEFELNLDDVYNKGKVTKWFDIFKEDRVQGQLLMEVTYTQANPQSKLFHQSLLPGAAIANTKKPFDYYVHHAGKMMKSARKEVQEELEHVHEHRPSPSSSKGNELKDLTLNQLHLNQNKSADTEISNPNTENDPSLWNTRNNEITPVKSHSPPSRVNQLKDSMLNQLHLGKGNLADTGMSNPNLAGLSDENLRRLLITAQTLTQDQRFSHLPGQHNGPCEIDKITTVYDTSLGALSHPRDRWNSGISNPNTIKEGINHHPYVKARIPEWVQPYYHPITYHKVDEIAGVNNTSLGRDGKNTASSRKSSSESR